MQLTGIDLVHEVGLLILQLAVILLFAKIGAEICERFLKQPAVLGELLIGVILSPFLLGGYITVPGFGPLFPLPQGGGGIPIAAPLYGFAEIAVILLLFRTGLETNLQQFLKYAGKSTVIAAGGVFFPFLAGACCAVLFGAAPSLTSPAALFIGSIMTATSVGITARVLSDFNKLDSPEGVTILGSAVVDDVIGILILSIVVALAAADATGAQLDLARIARIALGAIGFWVGFTVLGILCARQIERLFLFFHSRGAVVPLGIAFCFLAAAAAEAAGLAMIIGAYAFGLALSTRPIARELMEGLEPIGDFFIPIFFVVTGMMVDLQAMGNVVLFGAVLSLAAVLTKWLGCALPALSCGFTRQEANRIGVGMVPRGEVALIIAQVGIAKGIIAQDVYGVAIMMTLVTTMVAPVWLQRVYKRG